MPYPTNASLPPAVKDKIKSPRKRRQWRHVWNSEYKRHGDESRAFASAWSVVQKGAKVSQENAEYVTKSVRYPLRCAICTMFREPGSCTTVAGEISPAGWCKFFEKVKFRAAVEKSIPANYAPYSAYLFPPWLRFL